MVLPCSPHSSPGSRNTSPTSILNIPNRIINNPTTNLGSPPHNNHIKNLNMKPSHRNNKVEVILIVIIITSLLAGSLVLRYDGWQANRIFTFARASIS